MTNLGDKRALITGATGGIGSSIAEILYKLGVKLALTGTNKEKLALLSDKFKNDVIVIPTDISKDYNVKNLVDVAEKKLNGNIEILVNNAGINRDNLSIRMKNEDWFDVINLTLNSTFFLSREVIRGMMKNKYGRIINISSIIGVTGNIGQSNYSASKAGMIGMTKSLALEVASRGITVNCIAPGFIKTEMTESILEKRSDEILSVIPQRRIGEARDVANLVKFLSSDEASYITGQTIHLNGGLVMV